MHNHKNNNDGGHKGMMWMMLPCLLILGFALFSGNSASPGGYFWSILIGVFMLAHVWMMFKGHGGHGNASTEDGANDSQGEESKTKGTDNKNNQGGSCH